MRRDFWTLVFISSFGRGSSKPISTALLKLSAACTLAFLFAWQLLRPIRTASLPQDIPVWWLLLVTAFISFVVVGLIQMLLAPVMSGAGQSADIQRLTSVLPLSRPYIFFLRVLPLSLVVLIIASFGVPVLAALAEALNAPPTGLIAVNLFAMIAAIGFASFSRMTILWKLISLVVFLTIGAKLIEISLNASTARQTIIAAIIALSIVVCFSSLVWTYFSAMPLAISKTSKAANILPFASLAWLWFLLKMLRNKRTLNSIAFVAFVSVTMAAAIIIRDLGSVNPSGWFMFGGLLACALACDTRGIARRFRTPEVAALRGVGYFVISEYVAALIICLLVGMPILIAVASQNTNFGASLVVLWFALQLFGAAAGLLASTLFVPENGDIGAQFFTATCAIGLLFLIPKIADFSEISVILQSVSWTLAGFICPALAFLIRTT